MGDAMAIASDLTCPCCGATITRLAVMGSIRVLQPYHLCSQCDAPLRLTLPVIPVVTATLVAGAFLILGFALTGRAMAPLVIPALFVTTVLPLTWFYLTAHRYPGIDQRWDLTARLRAVAADPRSHRPHLGSREITDLHGVFSSMQQWVAAGRVRQADRDRARGWVDRIAPGIAVMGQP
jgi:hypothetical protein